MCAVPMVHLSRIYTMSGDTGTTQLGDGSTLPKHHLRVAAYGNIDELNSVIGIMLVHGVGESTAERLRQIQNDLFDVGSDLCVPGEAGEKLRITAVYAERLEGWIDEVNKALEPINSFVLPGGSQAAAWLHLARTVCRRTERSIVELFAREEGGRVNGEVLKYVNRLSDLFFVLAREANDHGRGDVLWVPGQNG